jgi:hypothetical protein
MLSLAAALALLGLACFNEEEPPPPKPEPTSPAVVLTDVAISFNQRNAELLELVLSTDFVFYFDPRDVGPTIPESISHTEFCGAVNNMLEHAYSLSFTIYVDTVGSPSGSATKYRAEYVKLNFVLMVDERNGFAINQGYFNFEFERYEAASGKKYWRLTGWWDRTSTYFDERPGVAPASFGRALALYF